jgi:hypothetical protein
VVHREQDLVRELEAPVPEGFLEQIVGSGHRADERVLDGQDAGIGIAVPDRGHDILHLAARNRFELGPPAAGGGFAEGAHGPLDGYAHTLSAPRG